VANCFYLTRSWGYFQYLYHILCLQSMNRPAWFFALIFFEGSFSQIKG